MAPEAMYQTRRQSPKMDVWSLFVVIGVVTQAGGLHDPTLADYGEVLPRVRAAAAQHAALSPMAQENPETRSSAAQMLVKCFDGQGLSTPRNQVGPMPDPASMLAQPQASEQREPDPRSKAPKPRVKRPAAVDLRRANYKYAPRKLPANRNDPQRDIHPKVLAEIERRGESLGLQLFT
ncbi:hypothetical protein BU26DRAFT_434010 [Trematosphaeria pertusa]|uniref:Protein kinase domain-containing protein n=1 Tax=Trematosphaeria pertusa TaxID=390896 RepID=A0A6A6I4F7_9PLEO|nr:uncharacterized protein BU26DRAFT_434010 [Trematosphaeria pertusa]KAF2245187.1 hypothetical protein BU26DRAFT_434010 [Trematosphaeria pertusa]